MVGYPAPWMSCRAYFRSVCCHVDAVTALPSLARGMLDGVTHHIGLTVGKGPLFVYLPSWVPTPKVQRSAVLLVEASELAVDKNWGNLSCVFFFQRSLPKPFLPSALRIFPCQKIKKCSKHGNI